MPSLVCFLVQAMMADLILGCARASHALSRDEIGQCHALAEVAKEVCKQSAAKFVAASQHAPMLQSCSCDGTPIQVSIAAQASLPNGRVIRRHGKSASEFLISHSFLRSHNESGDASTVAVLCDPIPLTEGKGALQISSAARSTWCSLRQFGHRGGVIQHYSWDRCGFSALQRHAHQFHELMRDQWHSEARSSDLLWLLEWLVFTPCAVHDAQNAFKWAIKDKFDNSELLRTVFIGSCSVRNSMDIILAYLAEWVSVSIKFVAALDDSGKHDLRVLWRTLGVEEDVVQVLVDVLELRMDDRRLLVTAVGTHQQDTINIVTSALMAVWRARKFTDSRWLSMGRSARAMVASRLSGLHCMLEYAAKKPSVSGYYVNGFFRMTDEHWLF